MAVIVPISLLTLDILVITTIKKKVNKNSRIVALYGGNPSADVVSPKTDFQEIETTIKTQQKLLQ